MYKMGYMKQYETINMNEKTLLENVFSLISFPVPATVSLLSVPATTRWKIKQRFY